MAGKVILTRADLDGAVCSEEGCDCGAGAELYLHGRCHMDSPTWAKYAGGVLEITCAACDRVIARIEVAS